MQWHSGILIVQEVSASRIKQNMLGISYQTVQPSRFCQDSPDLVENPDSQPIYNRDG